MTFKKKVAASQPELRSTGNHRPLFAIGDHVYKWCRIHGMRFQRHAIVIRVDNNKVGDKNDLTIVEFCSPTEPENIPTNDEDDDQSQLSQLVTLQRQHSFMLPSSPSVLGSSVRDKLQRQGKSCSLLTSHGPFEYKTMPKFLNLVEQTKTDLSRDWRMTVDNLIQTSTVSSREWHKVAYRANLWQRLYLAPSTFNVAASDSPELVIARVDFLFDHEHLIPKHHIADSNCEGMAIWCKTGQWSSFQAKSSSKDQDSATLAATGPFHLLAAVDDHVAASLQQSVRRESGWEWKLGTPDFLNQEFRSFVEDNRPTLLAECTKFRNSRAK